MGILPASVWTEENMILGTDQQVYDMLDSLECPDHLVELSMTSEGVYDAFCEAHFEDILFHLEQSCDSDGRLLSDEIRKTKLQNIPLTEHWKLEKFLAETDLYPLGQVAYFVFWLVRFERLSRTQNANLQLNPK